MSVAMKPRLTLRQAQGRPGTRSGCELEAGYGVAVG